MKIKFLSVAEQEFVEAIDYYNDQCLGLGYEFAAEISSTMERIVCFPKAWTKISPRTRRCLTNKFPFGVLYQVGEDSILVIAVMHMKRNPIHWQKRLDQ